MGYQDSAMKAFFSDSYVFADVFNYWLYDGAQILEAENFKEASESLISFSSKQKNRIGMSKESVETETKQLKSTEKFRDLVKYCICKEDGKSIYAIMAIEAQTDVDYSMAARAMIYDGRQYEKQLSGIRRKRERAIRQLGEQWTLRKFTEDDRLTPVITLIVYLGAMEWNGPRTLHDLLAPQDPVLLRYTADYKLNLIEPFAIDEEELDRFQSDMREVILYIKASENMKHLKQLSENQRFRKVSVSAARVINEVTKSQLTFNEEEEEIDMCKAIQGMREEERIEGRTEGKGSIILTFMEKSKCDLEAALEFFNIEHEEREGIIRFVEANR